MTTTETTLPAFLSEFFWDCEFTTLDWTSHRDFIVERVLSRGDWHGVCWLRTRLGDDDMREWLVDRRGAGLDARRLRLWEIVLRLPGGVVGDWLKARGRTVWRTRTR